MVAKELLVENNLTYGYQPDNIQPAQQFQFSLKFRYSHRDKSERVPLLPLICIMPENSSIQSSSIPTEPCPLPTRKSTKSFWHSEPDSFLLGHRSTADLPNYAKIVIVGSGITGASAARYFDELFNEKVLMLDAREACWGATGRVSEPIDIIISLYYNATILSAFLVFYFISGVLINH
jgi:hypothetical protein